MKVFISHSKCDNDIARDLADQLTKAGLEVWRWDDEIFPGDNVSKKLGEAMENSELFVVLVTERALESSWVQQEIQWALTNYKGRVVPVFMGADISKSANLPWILRKVNAVEVVPSANADWSKVVHDVLASA